MKNKKISLFFIAGIIIIIITAFFSITTGTKFISPIDIILGRLSDIDLNILKHSRLPRTVASILSGAALSVSGAVLQNVLSNKLASPGIIGINAGAGLGVTICCALGMLSGISVSIFAFMGSLLAVIIISVFAGKTNASKTTVILGGVALNSILSAVNESISVINRDVSLLTLDFRIGGFSAVSNTRLIPASVLIVVSLIILCTLCNELDIISLGDETAKSLGLSIKKYRIIFLIITALLSGAAVSFSGLLGFVGLIVPHFVRQISGNESRTLIPLSALYGGFFVCFSDTLTRLIFNPYELPVGILMAVTGGPIFVMLLVRLKGGHRNNA